MKYILTIILFFITLDIFGQNQIKLTILDNETKQPVPFASVFCKQKQFGIYADENGKFTVPSNIAFNDTLSISSVGYRTNHFIYISTTQDFYLKNTTNTLKEVSITPHGSEIILGSLKKSSHFVINLNQHKTRSELCFFMPNNNNQKGKVTSVSFYINEGGKPHSPFRIRIYNAKNGKPFQDLLTSNLVTQGGRKGGWLEINIEKYNIPFESDGIFISMESLYGLKQSSFYKVTNMKTGKIEIEYGQSLGLTDEFETAIAFQRKFNMEWQAFSQKFEMFSDKTFYPMIRAKIKLNE
jgi:hypothetical protein